MMGFGEEAGVIPRFCKELFARVSSADKNEVSSQRSTFSAHLILRTSLIN